MDILFWITTAACICAWIFRMCKGDFFSILTYVVTGIYLPMFLYFAGWSVLFLTPIQHDFYWIFIVFNMLLLLVQFLDPLVKRPHGLRFSYKLGPAFLAIVDIVYLLAMFAENYMGSGRVLPGLAGIDIHTYHAPILFYITGATYIVVALNTLAALDGKKWLLAFDVLVVALLFFGKSARMDAFIAIVECVSLVAFVGIPEAIRRKPSMPKKPRSKAKKVLTAAAVVAVLVFVVQMGINIGNDRMNSYGRYDITYGDGIGYCGPELLGDALSLYYGYFPFSFYNLDNNIAFVGQQGTFAGINSYRAFYFGVLQFDNLFDLPLNEANSSKVVVTKGATVTTGFWDFYYDYGQLCAIPMAVTLLIYLLLRRSLAKNYKCFPACILAYFYWVPLWFFMSFNDTVWDTCVLVNLILIALVSGKAFVLSVGKTPAGCDETGVQRFRRKSLHVGR